MPDWDDEYAFPYLATGHIGPLDRSHKGPVKKVNTGFQPPGNEFPAKPKPRPRVRTKPAAKRKAPPKAAKRRPR